MSTFIKLQIAGKWGVIVLASASPRRGEILSNAGIPYIREVPADVDETPAPGEDPREYVMRLARAKAGAIAVNSDRIVLGADTTVVIDGRIFGKPSDEDDAARILRILSGRAHEVMSGVCLMGRGGAVIDAATTRVWFASLSEEEIEGYVASGEPMDKAGAYGIQKLGSRFVTRVEGCYFNVMGLPISLVYSHLRRMNPSFML